MDVVVISVVFGISILLGGAALWYYFMHPPGNHPRASTEVVPAGQAAAAAQPATPPEAAWYVRTWNVVQPAFNWTWFMRTVYAVCITSVVTLVLVVIFAFTFPKEYVEAFHLQRISSFSWQMNPNGSPYGFGWLKDWEKEVMERNIAAERDRLELLGKTKKDNALRIDQKGGGAVVHFTVPDAPETVHTGVFVGMNQSAYVSSPTWIENLHIGFLRNGWPSLLHVRGDMLTETKPLSVLNDKQKSEVVFSTALVPQGTYTLRISVSGAALQPGEYAPGTVADTVYRN